MGQEENPYGSAERHHPLVQRGIQYPQHSRHAVRRAAAGAYRL